MSDAQRWPESSDSSSDEKNSVERTQNQDLPEEQLQSLLSEITIPGMPRGPT